MAGAFSVHITTVPWSSTRRLLLHSMRALGSWIRRMRSRLGRIGRGSAKRRESIAGASWVGCFAVCTVHRRGFVGGFSFLLLLLSSHSYPGVLHDKSTITVHPLVVILPSSFHKYLNAILSISYSAETDCSSAAYVIPVPGTGVHQPI